MVNNQQVLKQNIVNNCMVLQQLFGLDNGLEIFVRSNVVVYGLTNTGKIFYSLEPHKRLSNIATYRTKVTVSFISDLSKELLSLLEHRDKNSSNKPLDNTIAFIEYSPNKSNSKTLQQQRINLERKRQGLKAVSFNDKDYYQ